MERRDTVRGQPPRKRFCSAENGGPGSNLFDRNFLALTETRSRSEGASTSSSPEREGTSGSNEEEESRIRYLVKRLLSEEVAGMNRIRAPAPIPDTECSRTVKPTEGTWKEAWKNKCEARLPYLNKVFSATAVESALVGAVMTVIPESENSPTNVLLNTAGHASKWYAAIKFSKQPGRPKSVWLSAEGKAQSNFRNVVVRNVIRNVHANGTDIIRKVLNESPASMLLDDEIPKVPEWMDEGFLTTNDVEIVLKRKEGSSGSKGRRLRTKQLQNVDVARYAIEHLYTLLTKVLISSRRRVDEAFFGRIGYVFINWNITPVKYRSTETVVDQTSLKIEFPPRLDELLNSDVFSKVAEANVCQEEGDTANVNARNASEFEKLNVLLGGLYVDIEHDVLVRCPGGYRKDRIRRRVKFLELAVQMVLTFSYGMDNARVYRSNRSSFKKISSFAVLLCVLVRKAERARNENETGSVLDLTNITVGSTCLNQFMPCDYRIREVIRKGGCLTCTESQTMQ